MFFHLKIGSRQIGETSTKLYSLEEGPALYKHNGSGIFRPGLHQTKNINRRLKKIETWVWEGGLSYVIIFTVVSCFYVWIELSQRIMNIRSAKWKIWILFKLQILIKEI